MTLAKQIATITDFGYSLLEGDSLPFVGAPGSGSLQDLCKTVGVVKGLYSRQALGAHFTVSFSRIFQRRLKVQVRQTILRTIGVAVYLDQHAILDFAAHRASNMTLEAHAIYRVLRVIVSIVIVIKVLCPGHRCR